MIEDAYQIGEAMGLSVWCTDQAWPFQAVPQPGQSWRPEGRPARRPHDYFRNGTAKVLTLFQPADGRARVKGVTACPNAVLHAWLKRELTAVLAEMPPAPAPATQAAADPSIGDAWRRWLEGLTIATPPSPDLPPLRMLLVLDNLAGHKTPELVCWLFAQGIMALYTPLGGSWLNMAESLRRILKRRALEGQEPGTPAQIIGWFEAVAEHWNRSPTPFVWGGKRAARRQCRREGRHRLGGSGACAATTIKRPG
ncbi:transposase [Isosphaeraceae bacterium EP7]